MRLVKRHPLITFFGLTYAVAWAFLPLGSFGRFAALITAFIVIPLSQGLSGLRDLGTRVIRWRVGWIWYAIALGLRSTRPPWGSTSPPEARLVVGRERSRGGALRNELS
jgi:hypothetical protein